MMASLGLLLMCSLVPSKGSLPQSMANRITPRDHTSSGGPTEEQRWEIEVENEGRDWRWRESVEVQMMGSGRDVKYGERDRVRGLQSSRDSFYALRSKAEKKSENR